MIVDANEFVFERRSGFDFGFEKEENENALERLLGKLGEILNADARETKRDEEEAKSLSPRRTTTGELGTDKTDAIRNDKSNNNNIPRSGIFGYASKDSEHQTVVFLDDISCVSFIYGEQSVVRFVRAVQRMSRARGVVVRERVFSSSSTTTTATNGGGNERSSSRRSRRRRSGRSAASDVLANDASCSCAMTLSRQSNGSIRSKAGSGRKTLFTAEAKRGATRKTRETDVVQFVKVPSSSSSGTTTNQCIALEYTSIDDALRNEKDIQKARERSRTEKLTDKLNKFSTFNLGINATNGETNANETLNATSNSRTNTKEERQQQMTSSRPRPRRHRGPTPKPQPSAKRSLATPAVSSAAPAKATARRSKKTCSNTSVTKRMNTITDLVSIRMKRLMI